jgi:serine/threonine protein kinase
MHDRLSCDNGIPEGVLKGTPGWMSPERIHRERKLDWLGPETDIYSFGCVAYAVRLLPS